MTSFLPEPLYEIWSRSHWLRASHRAFATSSQKEKWSELDKVSAMEQFKASFESPEKKGLGFFDSFAGAFETIAPVINARSELTREVQENVKRWLKDGQLVGLGFSAPRLLESEVCILPAESWHGHIDWDGSELRFQSMRFVDVRLVQANLLEKARMPTEEALRSRGRPTIVPDLMECFGCLNSEGEIDTSCSMKSHYPKIRAWLNENKSTKNSVEFEVSDEAIRKSFSPFFKALKAEPKA